MNYFIGLITRLHTEHPSEVETYFKETFNQKFSEAALTEVTLDALKMFSRDLKNYIAFETSPLTVEQIKAILLASEVPIGATLQAFTDYTCVRCGITQKWGNSGVPKLCDECRTGAAERVILSGVLKEIVKPFDPWEREESKILRKSHRLNLSFVNGVPRKMDVGKEQKE